jgi:hypothetical protein
MKFGELTERADYLDGLVLDGPVRIGHVLERDAVKLALVDVSDAVVLPSLAGRYRRLQVVAESVRRVPVINQQIIHRIGRSAPLNNNIGGPGA